MRIRAGSVRIAAAALGCALAASGVAAQGVPMTGPAVPGMASFDRTMLRLLATWQIPGGAVAVARDGRLVFARGYGLAESEAAQPVLPDALFRIASLSKPITAAAVLRLVEDGRLDLDTRAFALLRPLAPPGIDPDPRLERITVRQLMQHSGGWDPSRSFDPMFMPWTRRAAEAVGAPAPASCETVIRFMRGQRLDFDPGTAYAYSNFGYCVLGRVVEAASGQRYEEYVRAQVLERAGITRMRIGRTLLQGRAEGEVRYYGFPGQGTAPSVFPEGGQVPLPYGGFYLEAMDSHGGWIASAVDLVRFASALSRGAVLRPETVRPMVARPSPPLWAGSAAYCAMGWMVRPAGRDANWWHVGSLPGTASIVVRTSDGMVWAALFNSRPQNADRFTEELDAALWQAVRDVTEWPSHDLFGQFR